MKRLTTVCALALALTMALAPAAHAAEWADPAQVCYPTSVTRNEDGTEIRKIYDLSPEDDPVGIPRSDFQQDGYHYTLVDLLKQELPDCKTMVGGAVLTQTYADMIGADFYSKDAMGSVRYANDLFA